MLFSVSERKRIVSNFLMFVIREDEFNEGEKQFKVCRCLVLVMRNVLRNTSGILPLG